MGNFSRDSFQETNVLHNLLTPGPAPVANARHYVGVRLQQGVPLLDADWNEMEDIRRLELMALLRHFIGNGVPAGNQGFRILTTSGQNNFAIGKGVILFDGLLVINDSLTTYKTQPNKPLAPDLVTPAADRGDLVYLDAWDDETNAQVGDSRLINPLIGVETAVRIERKWAVRVREGSATLPAAPAGHAYIPLARLNRRATDDVISADMILDRRKTGITLAENLKIPLFLQVGLETLDLARFAEMLKGLRASLFERLRMGLLPHQTASTLNENVLLIALQEIMHRAQVGEVQAVSRNLDNRDGLEFMRGLHTIQGDFLSVLASIGNIGNIAQSFITDYTKYLDGSAPGAPPPLIKGLKLALDNQDLLAAVMAQEEANGFLSAPVNALPEGAVTALYNLALVAGPLTNGAPYVFPYAVESQVTSPLGSENFNLTVSLSASSWTAALSQNSVTLTNLGGKATVLVTVTPNSADPQSTLTLVATAARNPLIRSSQPGVQLQIGLEPPVGSFFFYADAALNAQGRLEIRQSHLTRTTGRNVEFSIRNTNVSETRTYRLVHTIDPAGADTGWIPISGSPATRNVQVNPDTTTDTPLRVDGPKPPAAAPPLGTTGEIVATATLIEINGSPINNGATVTIRLNFTVVA